MQTVRLGFDTGSSDVWVPSADAIPCRKGSCTFGSFNPNVSSTYAPSEFANGTFVNVYGSQIARGSYFTDTITFADATIPNMVLQLGTNITLITQNTTNGLFGAALPDLESAHGPYNVTHPNALDLMVSSGIIDRKLFSLYLDDLELGMGSVIFGGIDTSKFVPPLVTLPVQKDFTGNYSRWSIDLTSISYTGANTTTVLSASNTSTPAVFDSGYSSVSLPLEVTTALASGLGATVNGSYYFVSCDLINRTQNDYLTFTFGGAHGATLKVPLSGFILPLPTFKYSNGVPACPLVIQTPEAAAASSFGGYTLGYPIMQYAYIVYDQDNLEVSIAQAKLGQNSTDSATALSSGAPVPDIASTATGTATRFVSLSLPSGNSSSATTASAAGVPGTPTLTGIASTTGSAKVSQSSYAGRAAAVQDNGWNVLSGLLVGALAALA